MGFQGAACVVCKVGREKVEGGREGGWVGEREGVTCEREYWKEGEREGGREEGEREEVREGERRREGVSMSLSIYLST